MEDLPVTPMLSAFLSDTESALAWYDEAAVATLSRHGLHLPDGVPSRPLTMLCLLAGVLFIFCCCRCCCQCCCAGRLRRAHGAEPLLPKYAPRSDQLPNQHEGRPCRAGAYCAAAATGSAQTPAANAQKSKGGGTGGLNGAHSNHYNGATSPSPQAKEVSPPRNGSAPKPQQERGGNVADTDAEAAEGGRGGGWGDLDGFPETLTISRYEYPTSRRGADRDEQRARYLSEHAPEQAVPAPRRSREAGNARNGAAAGNTAPRGRGRR